MTFIQAVARPATRWLAAFLCGGMALTAGAGGYLPRVGPATLRFQTAAASQPVAALPPLIMKDDVTVPTEVALPAKPSEPPPTTPAASAGPDATTVTTNAAAGGPENFTPQMLIKFFGPKRNGGDKPGTSAVVPFGFTPPTPGAPPPSSSATYTQP